MVPSIVVVLGLALITFAVARVHRLRDVTSPQSGRRAIRQHDDNSDVAALYVGGGPADKLAHAGAVDAGAVDSGVDVVIPARDEAGVIGGLLGDLTSQECPPRRIIVVDDESTDDTAKIAAHHGAEVVRAPQRPAGWNPKVWAMHTGVGISDGERVLFLDADVRLARGAVASIVAAGRASGGLMSVAPYHCRIKPDGTHDVVRPLGAVESLSAPFNITIDAGGGPGVARSARGAIGSCLTISRADYDHCGGHQATPATIVDDLALAASARRVGLPVTLMQSRPTRSERALVAVRSYPEGLRALARGWIKNLSAGLGMTPMGSSLAVALWITALVMPIALVVQARWILAAVLWVVVGVHTWWLCRLVGRFQPIVVSVGAPFLGVWFAAISVLSVVVRVTGRKVHWKGRPLRPDGVDR